MLEAHGLKYVKGADLHVCMLARPHISHQPLSPKFPTMEYISASVVQNQWKNQEKIFNLEDFSL